jgi:hypothetical protein
MLAHPPDGRETAKMLGVTFPLSVRRPYISGMLRMRKKPPEGQPNINSGTPWSAMDVADLEELLGMGRPIEAVASYLCRDVDEVETEAKVRGRISK